MPLNIYSFLIATTLAEKEFKARGIENPDRVKQLGLVASLFSPADGRGLGASVIPAVLVQQVARREADAAPPTPSGSSPTGGRPPEDPARPPEDPTRPPEDPRRTGGEPPPDIRKTSTASGAGAATGVGAGATTGGNTPAGGNQPTTGGNQPAGTSGGNQPTGVTQTAPSVQSSGNAPTSAEFAALSSRVSDVESRFADYPRVIGDTVSVARQKLEPAFEVNVLPMSDEDLAKFTAIKGSDAKADAYIKAQIPDPSKFQKHFRGTGVVLVIEPEAGEVAQTPPSVPGVGAPVIPEQPASSGSQPQRQQAAAGRRRAGG